MIRLAIQGHNTRGKEVIEILEMLGGKTSYECSYKDGFDSSYFFFINTDENFSIDGLAYNNEELKNYYIFTLEEFLEKFPYKVGDKVKCARINDFIGRVINVRWDENENQIIYVVEWDDIIKSTLTYFANGLQPYKEETMEDIIKIDIPKGYEFAGVDDDKQQVVFEKIGYHYPKTYEECCKVLMGKTNFQDFSLVLTKLSANINEENSISPDAPHITLINNFYKLLICRYSYWKIAGEQMGLEKPWEPDWTKADERKYCIVNTEWNITKWVQKTTNKILAFPTEEMRDVFYENFKSEIEQCKELL